MHNMTYDEFKQNFLPEFLNINSYAGRMRYANERLNRIGSGTGRVVYDIDDEKVLKLAMNGKGVAQNGAEGGAGYYRDTQHIVTKVFDSADDDTWLIAEKAKKVNEKRIKELTDIPSLVKLFYFLRNYEEHSKGRDDIHGKPNITPENNEFFWENEFAQDLANFIANYQQTAGDMGRPSSYGEVLRDGQPTIVLTDYGLNDEVYDNYYSGRKKQKYAIYELFNYADGNDDILSDVGGGQDIRTGIWAQVPYSVDDGHGVINEEFIDFVNNRDSYPDKPISNLPLLTDMFHECINNISEVMKITKNKKRFYENLLTLQEYLIRRGFYTRESLISESEIPDVEYASLSEKNYTTRLANEFTNKMGLTTPRYLGGGGFGHAYELNDKVILKITSDMGEADAASKLLRANPKYLSEIYHLYKILDTKKNKTFFVILEENIKDKPINDFQKYENDINKIQPNGMDYQDILIHIKKPKNFDYNNMIEHGKHILTDNPEANVSEQDRQIAYKYFIGIMNIRQELLDYGIKSTDYVAFKNLGYNNGVLKFFDIGGHITFEPQISDDAVVKLPEDGSAKFSSDTAINQDEFPPYNTNDTSPSINNDLDANIAMYEDLIYNHIVGDATEDKYQISETVEGGEYHAYHGSDTEIKKFVDSFVGTENATDQEGPGIYFSTNLEDVRAYGSYIHSVILRPRKLVDESGHEDVNEDEIIQLIRSAPDWEMTAQNWAENPETGLREAINSFMRYSENEKDLFQQIWYDFFRYHPVEFIRGMVKLGYDGQIIDKAEDNKHFIIYNPEIIEIINTEPLEEDRKKAWMPGSKSVTVKKKCRLGGNPDGTSVACNQGDINNLEFGSLDEGNVPYGQTFWAWVSPDNKFIQVPKLKHMNYIMTVYKDSEFSYDYDKVFDQALKDGWIRVIYERFPERFYSELSLNGYDSDRVKTVFKEMFYDLVKYGNSRIYLEYENPKGYDVFSTYDSEGKAKLVNYITENLNEVGEGSSEPYPVEIEKSTDMAKVYNFKTEDDDDYRIEFTRGSLDDNMWDVSFRIINEFGKFDNTYTDVVNKGRVYRIMATLLKVVRGFFANTKPDILVMEPTKTKTNYDDRRFLLYLSYINKNLPPEYEMTKNNKEILIKKKGLDEYYSSLVPRVDESNIMSIQNLPFRQEIEGLGGEIYAVGGAVRDEFLGKESKDLDIIIRGIPEDKLAQVLAKYGKVNAVGESFAVTKFIPTGTNEEIDIALPRTEVSTGEGHKDFEIKSDYRLPIEKDLERRDFTINAVAKNMDGNIIDPFKGINDLKSGVIRVTHPKSFEDDPLRMLRAVQFASRFGFNIDPKTYKMIAENAPKIKTVVKERVQEELQKIVDKGDAHTGAFLLKDTGLLKQMGVDAPLLVSNIWSNVKTLAEYVYLLSHNAMSPISFYMNNMRGDSDIVNELQGLIEGMQAENLENPIINRSTAHNMILKSKGVKVLESKILPMKLQIAAQELLQGKYPKTVNDLAVNGNDLMTKGLRGKAIGDMQKAMLIKIYADKVRNDREELLSLIDESNIVKEGFAEYSRVKPDTWNINDEEVDINFFVDKYDKWNSQGGEDSGYKNPSRASVLEFLQNNYEDFSNDDKLNKYLFWKLIDREFLNESNEQIEYGALMLFLDVPVWEKIISIIKKDDIYEKDGEFGIETEPHVTILYGFHTEVSVDDVFDLYKENFELKPIEIGVEGISIFESEEFDVVKMDVSSKILTKMNSVMRELPSTIRFLKYNAHITLAYVKKGRGKNYVKAFKKNRILIGNELVFSTKKEKQSKLKLTEKGILKENEEPMKKISYSAVVLDDKSRTALLKVFSPMIPEGWDVIAHHMTIKLGALQDDSQEKKDIVDKKTIMLHVVDYAIDDKVMAVGVEGYLTNNEKAHITIAVNRAGGGKPFLSNKLTDWRPLGFPLELTGKVKEIKK